MKPQTKRLSAWMTLFVVSGYVVCPTFCKADATGIASPVPSSLANNGTNGAMLSPIPIVGSVKQIGGSVERRDPIDQGERLGPVMSCKQGDQLVEGSVISTGPKSFAHLFWSGTETRIWADTVIRVLPCAKTVCLLNGALMFHKSRQCKDNECIVETKRLQARIRGTHVRVHSSASVDTILVLECSKQPVEVYNKLNGSKVSLTPGVELEVRGQINSTDPRFILKSENPIQEPKQQNFPLTRLNPNKGELIFQDKHSITMAYTANAKAVLQDPMLSGDARTPALESLAEIREAMTKVPTSDNIIGNLIDNAINGGKPDKLIARNLKILGVPTKTYYIGPNIGSDKSIALPSQAYNDLALSPAGVMTAINVAPTSSRAVASNRVAPVAAPMLLHDNAIPPQNPAEQLTVSEPAPILNDDLPQTAQKASWNRNDSDNSNIGRN